MIDIDIYIDYWRPAMVERCMLYLHVSSLSGPISKLKERGIVLYYLKVNGGPR